MAENYVRIYQQLRSRYPQRDLWSVSSLCCLIADLRPLACVIFNWTLDIRR